MRYPTSFFHLLMQKHSNPAGFTLPEAGEIHRSYLFHPLKHELLGGQGSLNDRL